MLNFFNLFTKTKIKDSVRIGLLMTAFSCSSIQTIKGLTSEEQFQKKEIKEVPSINTPSIDVEKNTQFNEKNENQNEVANNAIEFANETQCLSNDSLKNQEAQNNNVENTSTLNNSASTDNQQIFFTPPVSNLAQDPNTDKKKTKVESQNQDSENFLIKSENQDDNKIKITKDTPKKSSYGFVPNTILSAKVLEIPVETIKPTLASGFFSKFLDNILDNIPAAKEVIQKDATTNPLNGVMWIDLFNKMQEIENSNLSLSEKEKSIKELYQSINNTIEKNHSSKTPPVAALSLNDQKSIITTIDEIMRKRIEAGIEEKMVLHEKKMYIIAGVTVGAITLICLIFSYLSKKKNSDD